LKIVVVIPALNEEASIDAVLAAIPAHLAHEIVVVDNGSTDATAARARAAGATVLQASPSGYGRACFVGAAYALECGAEIVVFLDGDFSDDPREMPDLVAPILRGEADLVVGSRLRGGLAPGAMPWHARFGNHLVSAMMNARYGLALTDLGPFRAIRADLYRRLLMREMTYGWPVEMIAKVARSNARVAEISVSYRQRIGQSKISGTVKGTIGATYFLLTRTFLYAGWTSER
jgi:glycosyltransferase involved in cell wall biosynthesis